MKTLDPGGLGPRADRYASQLLHDEPNVRVVGFHLEAGQVVPPHSSPATVMVQVVQGSGTFRGAGGAEARLAAGESAVYAPGEEHSIEADSGTLRFLAIITPRPS